MGTGPELKGQLFGRRIILLDHVGVIEPLIQSDIGLSYEAKLLDIFQSLHELGHYVFIVGGSDTPAIRAWKSETPISLLEIQKSHPTHRIIYFSGPSASAEVVSITLQKGGLYVSVNCPNPDPRAAQHLPNEHSVVAWLSEMCATTLSGLIYADFTRLS